MTSDEAVAAQRMLKVLDEQIAVLKRRSDRVNADWVLSPTDRQLFFYSSDNNGVMRFHSDSSFVAEQIFVYGSPLGNRVFLSIEDMASGRGITFAQEPRFDDNTDTTTKTNGMWIPPSAWAPTMFNVAYMGQYASDVSNWNFDHVVTLETDFVVARGGALRFRFRHSSDGNFWPTSTPPRVTALNYTVTLVGYKVY